MESYVIEITCLIVNEFDRTTMSPVEMSLNYRTQEEAHLAIRVLRRVIPRNNRTGKVSTSSTFDHKAWALLSEDQKIALCAEDELFESCFKGIRDSLGDYCWIWKVRSLKKVTTETLPLPPEV